MLLEKYTPKSTKEIVGNGLRIAEIKRFLSSWKKGSAILVHGPTGSSKSTAIKLAAHELGYDVVESHGDEKRSVDSFFQSSVQRGIFSKKRMLLFEDIETLPMRGMAELTKRSEHPVICTIGDAYQLSTPVRKNFKLVKFDKISEAELLAFAESVCRKENMQLNRRQLEQLAKTSNGDIRVLLTDMELLALGCKPSYRDSEDNIFNTLKIIFKTMSLENSKIAADNCEKEPEELMRWLGENVSEEYTDIRTVAKAFDYLSRADIFNSRIIRRQSWSLQKYLALAAYGTALAKERPSARFVSYRPPRFQQRISAVEGLSKSLHISRRKMAIYAPVLKLLAKRNSTIFEEFGVEPIR